MPWRDGTGPLGLGPMTGRRAGYCAGYSISRYMNPWPRRFGFGHGFGWRRWLVTPAAPQPVQSTISEREALEREANLIKDEIKELQDELESIEKRFKELKGVTNE
ncbi:MAG: DUF5320 domain-containing protein [Candidatus Aenigmarchaeota archaeon]|nr:DUF5320 domain-containing protein [Candidatus Aenigmarchaeota archaeon]